MVVADHGSRQPCRLSFRVHGKAHPAVAVELSGHRAAFRSPHRLELASSVLLESAWADGSATRLPSRVRSVAPVSGDEHLAHVDVCGVEGDWASFLEYLGPRALLC